MKGLVRLLHLTFLIPSKFKAKPEMSRRAKLAEWMTSPDNAYFARSYVNRIWGYLFGVGIIEPIDDIRAGNPPSNPDAFELFGERIHR